MSHDPIKAAFETYSMNAMQAAVNYIGGSQAVSEIWIYTDMADLSVGQAVYFRVGNEFLNSNEVANRELTDGVSAFELGREIANSGGRELLQTILHGNFQPPYRIIMSYDNINGGLAADWQYADDLGVTPQTSPGAMLEQWVVSMGGKPIYS
ncbi:hypothetical protein [Trueperella bialowiezensis]|uniref:Uncharacterized protein n=1 Tax=Trueperella bialowiezensis TaxID=312285 RepID=A0A448PGI9_9ACTO|nr:hypothetical protein [Trueperella bialowiezensis]VEI14067.1 Uncharacterised protein [Trueperella bialowiezensis]